MFAPPHVTAGPHMGMDPICMIALQAGMSGRSSSHPGNLEDQIAEIKLSLDGLEKDNKGLIRNIKQGFKSFDCNEGGNNEGTQCSPSMTIKGSNIINSIADHVKKQNDAPEACASVPGVSFYFEQFLPHLRYAGLPLRIISPSSAMANPVECGECPTNRIYNGECVIDPINGECPSPWEQANFCITTPCPPFMCKTSCVSSLEMPTPTTGTPPTITAPSACDPTNCTGSDRECRSEVCVCTDDNKQLVGGDCVDRCTDPTKPKWNGAKCVCEGNSCGTGKVCHNDGECNPFNWCDNCTCRYKKYFEDEGQVDIDNLCQDALFLKTDGNGEVKDKANRKCNKLEDLIKNIEEMNELKEELEELEDELDEEQDKADDLRRQCRRNPDLSICKRRAPGATEAGTFCTSCFQEVINAAYPKKSGWDRLFDSVVPLAGAGMAYYGIKQSNKLRAKQGFPVDNSAMYGLAYPFITSMLYGGALNGRGRNALACSPTAHQNPYGGIFGSYLQGGFQGGIHGGGGFYPGPGGFNLQGGFRGGGGFFPGPGGGGFFPGGGGFYPGPGGFNLQGGFRGGGGFFPGGGGFYPGPAGGLSLQGGLHGGFFPGPGGGGLFPGIHGGGGLFPGGGGLFPGGGGLAGGGFNHQYQAQLQIQQQMQSYYMQLQQFQMNQQRTRQSVMMKYQQEVQALSLKYQTYLSNTYSPGGGFPAPGAFNPGGTPGSTTGSSNPYQ